MGNGKRRISALLAIAALLFIPGMGLAAESASFSCSPAAGETVLPGDTVDYTLTIGQGGASDEWTALRIRLTEGMVIDQESVTVVLSPQPAETLAPEASTQPETKTTPDPSAAPTEDSLAEYEIVPGNDGFVVLFSSLGAGDEISFRAKVDSAQTDVSAYAQTEGFAVSVSHKLGALPQASVQPLQNDASVQADEQAEGFKSIRWALVVVCILLLCGIGLIAVRKWGGGIKWLPIRLPWKKEKTAVHEQTEIADDCRFLDDAEDAVSDTSTTAESVKEPQPQENSSAEPPVSM